MKQFGFEITKATASSEIPFDPIVVIVLERWVTTKESKAPQLSANLVSEEEIDEHIKNLKDDLDSVCISAKRAVRQAKSDAIARASSKGGASEPE